VFDEPLFCSILLSTFRPALSNVTLRYFSILALQLNMSPPPLGWTTWPVMYDESESDARKT
jgi:hypothetical protein